MNIFFHYFLIFFIYSIIGWVIETIYVSSRIKSFVNRGFLIGPYCPIYGYGALTMILYLEQYKDNMLTVFLLGVVICSFLEYITSYLMEKLFKTRWWDYSKRKFNLNGRVCGENSLLFGIGGVVIIYFFHPILISFLEKANETGLFAISIACFIIFLTDTILSLNIMNRLKKTVSSIELKKDSTQEISNMVWTAIREGHKIFQERLFSAFPNIEFKKLVEIKKDIKEEIKDFLNK